MKEALKYKDHPNVLFLYYEEMKEDIVKQLERINKFLGTNLTSKQLDNVSFLLLSYFFKKIHKLKKNS